MFDGSYVINDAHGRGRRGRGGGQPARLRWHECDNKFREVGMTTWLRWTTARL
jgi:hypothetical protein